jgi:hypothetical protein
MPEYRRKKVFRFSLLFFFLILASCGEPSTDEVVSQFMSENPTYTVLFCGVGEGGIGYAYYHIQYRKPNDDKIYTKTYGFT